MDTRFEIIEDETIDDEALPRKRKKKRRQRQSLNYVPWRLIFIVLAAGITIGIMGIYWFKQHKPTANKAVSNLELSVDNKHLMGDITDIAYLGHDLVGVDAAHIYVYNGVNFIQHLDTNTTNLVFSPDGKSLASLTLAYNANSTSTLVQLWDRQTGQLINSARIPDINPITISGLKTASLAFSPDGKLIAVITRIGITILDAHTLHTLSVISAEKTLNFNIIFGSGYIIASLQHERRTVGYSTDYATEIWDVSNPQKPTLSYRKPLVPGLSLFLAFSEDGRYGAYIEGTIQAGVSKNIIHIFDFLQRQDVGTLALDAGNMTLALSDDILAYIDGHTMNVVHWSLDQDGHFAYQPLIVPQPIPDSGISNLHLWSDEKGRGFDYLDNESHQLFRLNFTSSTLRVLSL